jgi:hypothetical protein
VFAANNNDDIYSALAPKLGPWQGMLHRRAAMCEALRVLAGFEASWDWNEGVDMEPGEGTGRPKREWETGVFQVSYNSEGIDDSLGDCVERLAGANDINTFLDAMKSNHTLAVEYCARLLRFDTSWDGPINKGWVQGAAWPPAVVEFQNFLSAGQPMLALAPASPVVAARAFTPAPKPVAPAKPTVPAVPKAPAKPMVVANPMAPVKPMVAAKPKVAAVPKAPAKPKVAAKAKAAAAKPKVKAAAKPKAKAKTAAKPKPKVKAKVAAKSKPAGKAKAKTKAKSKAATKPKIKAKGKAKTKAPAKTKAKAAKTKARGKKKRK